MIISGIVVYEPNIERLNECISSIIRQVDKIVIFMNSDVDKKSLINNSAIVYIGHGKNLGIANALNSIMNFAKSEKAEWCLLLDQDSVVPDNIIEEYESHKFLPDVAILTPNVIDKNSKFQNIEKSLKEVSVGITSGSYNNVDIWDKVGGFKEEFFIDLVDWEYFAKVKKNGYKAYLIPDVVLDHRLGNITYHKLLFFRIQTYNHSSFRKYFITRNTFAIHKLYPTCTEFKYPLLKTIKRTLIVIMFEDEKKKKIESIIRGFFDYMKCYKSN